MNDADEDDLDVYDAALGSERSKRILAYDAADEDEQIAMGSSRRRRTDNVRETYSIQRVSLTLCPSRVFLLNLG